MLKIELSNGFKFDFDETVLDNMELVDALAECENNELAIIPVCNLLLGKDTKKKLYDHLRDENGRVPIQAVMDSLMEILEEKAGKDGKN